MIMKKTSVLVRAVLAFSLIAATTGQVSLAQADDSNASTSSALNMDNNSWKFDKQHNVYYQIGITYVAKPADKTYEQLAIYIPGQYVTAHRNSVGGYALTINSKGKINTFGAANAPYVIPINTPGYASFPAGMYRG
jgi:hypothetical protein